MNLNPDCVRDLLLTLEDLLQFETDEHGSIYYPALPTENIENDPRMKRYTRAEIAYTTLKLTEADYITTFILNGDNMYNGAIYFSITYLGHQFLDTVRPPSVWAETKGIAKKVGSFALNILSSIAVGVITRRINNNI